MKIDEIVKSTPPGYLPDADIEVLISTCDGDRHAALGRVVQAAYSYGRNVQQIESARGHCQWLSDRNQRLVSERAGHALAALYRVGVASGGIALAWSFGSAWPILAVLPLLFLSPKTKN